MEVLLAIIGGATGAAFVTGVFSLILFRVKRKAEKKDKAEDRRIEEKSETQEALDDLRQGLMILLYDRIKHLGMSYIARNSISSEELEDLISMHKIYHGALQGNGFLDSLMGQVKGLPIRK